MCRARVAPWLRHFAVFASSARLLAVDIKRRKSSVKPCRRVKLLAPLLASRLELIARPPIFIMPIRSIMSKCIGASTLAASPRTTRQTRQPRKYRRCRNLFSNEGKAVDKFLLARGRPSADESKQHEAAPVAGRFACRHVSLSLKCVLASAIIEMRGARAPPSHAGACASAGAITRADIQHKPAAGRSAIGIPQSVMHGPISIVFIVVAIKRRQRQLA